MKQQHFPQDVKTYEKGINSDSNKEILGSSNGEHVDALNMRSLPMDGDNSAKKKIKGAITKYPNIDNRCIGGTGTTLSNRYECMLTMEIQGHIIEVWAANNWNENNPNFNPPLMRVDGKIVLMSGDFPVDVNHPLEYHKNENCVGGEIYITNNRTPPMVFSLKGLMENSGMTYGGHNPTIDPQCTQTYFSDFNINEYTVNITATLNKPQFVRQDSGSSLQTYSAVFGATGIPVGFYSYSYRFVTLDGDRSTWSPLTELIPVLENVATADNFFPNRRSYSNNADVTSSSGYGNHLKIRIQNYDNFDSIEIRRDSYNGGLGLGTPPVSEIIGLMTVQSGVYVAEILDRCNSNEIEEVITLDEQTDSLTSIQRAKAIRYYNDRLYLMNIGYASKDIDDVVNFVAPTALLSPTIQGMGKPGHKSVYNGTYYKSNMRGDTAGFGVVLFDAQGNLSYAKKIDGAESFTFPNRRDRITDQTTIGTSYKGFVVAGCTDGTITACHEVFDHKSASAREGNLNGNIKDQPFINNPNIDFDYQPLNPVSAQDSSSKYHLEPNDKIVDTFTQTNLLEAGLNGQGTDYNPKGFGLNYYSMGVAFKGISSFPEWASGFSVVQTNSVKKVLAQGLGWYAMQSADAGKLKANASKPTDRLWCFFPDFDPDTGGLYTNLYDEFINHFDNYKIQLVAPLGFFTDVYSFFQTFDGSAPDPTIQINKHNKGADIITYCRIIHDNGEINPRGCSGYTSGGIKYVGYGSNIVNNPPAVFSGNSNGNHLFTIKNAPTIKTTSSGRMSFLDIQLTESIYTTSGANNELNSNDEGSKKFQEPMYVVNIVREESEVVDLNTVQYSYTGHYIKLESLLLEGTDQDLQVPLTSERWEDCVPSLSGQLFNDYQTLNRFCFVENAFGEKKRWLNVTLKSPTEINTIMTGIQTNGFYTITDPFGESHDVFGVYKHIEVAIGEHIEVHLVFEEFNTFPKYMMVPGLGQKIYIRYDSRIPVRVFGGDTWINESVWAPIDEEYNKNADNVKGNNDGQSFRWNIGMPFRGYRIVKELVIMRDGALSTNYTQNAKVFSFQFNDQASEIRQWIAMWTAETRTNLSYAFNQNADKNSMDAFFPLKHYVQRPYKWKDNKFADGASEVYDDNRMHGQYEDDYGDEFLWWQYGGFRFKPQTNRDYSKRHTTQLITTTPQIGFIEQTEFCTRVLWSQKRPINAQYTPTVRTFPPSQFYDLSDDTGEIKFGWDAMSGDKGNNLYAFTDSGIALMLIDKRTIHEINANELATVGSDIQGILNHLWIDKSVGMHDETWRSWAEYSNALFFHNGIGAFMFANNQLSSLTDNGWQEMYRLRIAPYIGKGYSTKLSGVYNILNKEYIMNFDPIAFPPEEFQKGIVPISVIYGVSQEALQCRSTYNFEKYLSFDNKLYGMKDFTTYELGVGNLLDGSNMEASLVGVSDAEIFYDKEFIRIRVNSNSKPERIEFYDDFAQYLTAIPSSVVDATSSLVAIKNYFGYECYIPRKSVAPNYRQQGRAVIFKIVSRADENFVISSTGVQYKLLK